MNLREINIRHMRRFKHETVARVHRLHLPLYLVYYVSYATEGGMLKLCLGIGFLAYTIVELFGEEI